MTKKDHTFELLSTIEGAVAELNSDGKPLDLPELTDLAKDVIGDRTALLVTSQTIHPLRIRNDKATINPNYLLSHAEGAFRGLLPLTTSEEFSEGICLERVAIGAVLQTHFRQRGVWVDLSGAELCDVHDATQSTEWAEPLYGLLAEEQISIKALAARIARSKIPPEDHELAGAMIRSLVSPSQVLHSVQTTLFSDFRDGEGTTFHFDRPIEVVMKEKDVFTVSFPNIGSQPRLSIVRHDIGGDPELCVQVDEYCGLLYK